MYPFLYLYRQFFSWFHLGIAPSLLLWLVVDPALLIRGHREDGTGIPRDNYAMVLAEVNAVTGLLYGDFDYLYIGKESFRMSFLTILTHYLYNLFFLITTPIVGPLMIPFTFVSAFQLLVLYLYVTVLKQPEGAEDVEEVDVYY